MSHIFTCSRCHEGTDSIAGIRGSDKDYCLDCFRKLRAEAERQEVERVSGNWADETD